MPHILLVYDGKPTDARARADARRILLEHDRRDAIAARADADRGREAIRRLLIERVVNVVCLHSLARDAREDAAARWKDFAGEPITDKSIESRAAATRARYARPT